MATLDELGKALVNADAAGDVAAARALAGEITRMRQVAPAAAPATAPAPPADPFAAPTGAEAPPALAAMGYGELARTAGRTADNIVRAAANGMTFGLADRFAGGMDALTGQAPSYSEGVKAQHAESEARRQEQPAAAVVGDVAGGLAGGAGLVKNGVTLATRVGPALLPRVLGYGAEGAAYGAAHGAGSTYSERIADYIENAKKGATTGALIGGALPVVGNAAGALYRTAASFLGPRVEGASRGASALLRAAAQADEAGLRELPSMGPDAMLVDAGPAMLGLGQGAGTGTGSGRTALVNALRERDARTGQRLAEALDTNLGPASVPSRIEAGLSGDRAYAGLDYQPLLQNARPTNTRALANQLEDIAVVERGGAQRAAQQVRDMLDGQPLRNAAPGARPPLSDNPAVLLNTREAIDGMLKTEADPNVIRVLTQTRQAVDEELARSVPGIKAVDAQLAESHRQSAALQRGTQVLESGKTAIRPVELADEISQGALPQGKMVGPSAAPVRLRQGTRAELDRLVGTNVNDLNTLERKIGTPQDWNSQKLETIFGEGPVANVAKALMDNRRFRQAYQDIVQNSQTAQRVEAAASMKGAEGGNVPHDTTITGIGLKALNAVAKAISGASSARTKDEIGNILAQQGPAVERVARALLESARTTGENARAINRVLSSPYWISVTAPAAGRKSTQ
ncbi:hypothetical protein [Bradyrhizobium sp.]|jgi:hypothetical protein|uniref:hypothetical protein n=1 Tax=Bradyrhizobium sp. TaxID=376 RepID=UPI002DDCE159|nr:hypothetical protein [Bradyrhizobium sp.]HEV2160247.1 hypothetical protein [Bradyrhizobium sp.]